MSIKDSFLKTIFIFLLGASVLGIALINFFFYPSFKNMLIASTESEAVTIGQHMSRMIFTEPPSQSNVISSASIEDLNKSVEEFNLYKLKIFVPDGKTIFSTDKKDIGQVNDKDYFHSIVARGKIFSKVVRNGTKSLEDQQVEADVVETYVPLMRNGSFAGALEVYLDITEKSKMLHNTLVLCNFVAVILTLLFSAIIMAALSQLDKTIHERKRTNRSLEFINKRLKDEIVCRKKIQKEKENLIDKLQSSLDKVKLLSGFIPICASCKKIRDDKGYWNQIESYIRDHSEAEFSHGICPECAREHYPELWEHVEVKERNTKLVPA